MLRTTTKRPSVVIFALVAVAAVLSVGYIMALAILAPEQLAEATAAATDLVCDKCVGTSDIADSAVTSAKIGGSQVKNTDLGGNSVTTGKIADGQVTTPDIATDAVTSDKIGKGQIGSNEIGDNAVISQYIVNGEVKTEDIADNAINTAKILNGQVNGADIANEPFGVGTVDINPAAVRTADIGDGQVTTVKIANDAIKPNVHRVLGEGVEIAPGSSGTDTADCPAGESVTGGGFSTANVVVQVYANGPTDVNTWTVQGVNQGGGNHVLFAYALCIGPSP